MKKVLGQPADLSRHGAADRHLAHDLCFNIDEKMLPYLFGADLSSGCAILRELHKEIFASAAEHTAALHERFAKPVPCRDKTKLLTYLKELQAAGSSPTKETVMQYVKTVTGGIRALNNVHQLTDWLAPSDPGNQLSAIERKVAGWAVMDADTVSTTARLERERVPKVTTKAHTAQRFLVNTSPRALVLEGSSADSHTKVWVQSPVARATNARSRTAREIGARSVEKNTTPATLGKIVSRELFLFCASCVDVNSGFIAT